MTDMYPDHLNAALTETYHRAELNQLLELLARKKASNLGTVYADICRTCGVADLDHLPFHQLANAMASAQHQLCELNSDMLHKVYEAEVQTYLFMQHIHALKRALFGSLYNLAVHILDKESNEVSCICWDFIEDVFSREIPSLPETDNLFTMFKTTLIEQQLGQAPAQPNPLCRSHSDLECLD